MEIKSAKIVVTGPECTGKTTLATEIARRYGATLVPEYAREYLLQLDRPYNIHDLIHIARKQFDLITTAGMRGNTPVVVDTGLLVMKVWASVRFGKLPEEIKALHDAFVPELYVLCSPDIPWEYDTLRENPTDREDLFTRYLDEIRMSELPFCIASGRGEQRVASIEAALNDVFKNH